MPVLCLPDDPRQDLQRFACLGEIGRLALRTGDVLLDCQPDEGRRLHALSIGERCELVIGLDGHPDRPDLGGYVGARTLRDSVGAENIDRYLMPAVAVIVLISLAPLAVEVLKERRRKRVTTAA